MRKIRIFEHTWLDGVISPPEDSVCCADGGCRSTAYRTPAGAAALAERQGKNRYVGPPEAAR